MNNDCRERTCEALYGHAAWRGTNTGTLSLPPNGPPVRRSQGNTNKLVVWRNVQRRRRLTAVLKDAAPLRGHGRRRLMGVLGFLGCQMPRRRRMACALVERRMKGIDMNWLRGKKTYVVGAGMVVYGAWLYVVENRQVEGTQMVLAGLAAIFLRNGVANVRR